MRHVITFIVMVLSGTLSGAAYAAGADQTGAGEPATWQHHQETIDYYGVTESYTCTGIEDKMRQLLRYLGARADLKVSPMCTSQFGSMRQVFVRVDFYSLAPASTGATGTVMAHWVPVDISPSDPLFRDR